MRFAAASAFIACVVGGAIVAGGCGGRIDASAEVDAGDDGAIAEDAAIVDARRDDGSSRADGAAADASTFDASRDAGADARARDASPPPNEAGVCAPGSTSGFNPPPYRGAAQMLGACTDAQITAFTKDCVAVGSTTQSCERFANDPSNGNCTRCLLTDTNAPMVGPVLIDNGVGALNVAGCIQLRDPSQIACAEEIEAARACEDFACNASCPVTDDASAQAYQQCLEEAGRGSCAMLASKSDACTGAQRNGPAAPCIDSQSSSDVVFTQYASLFCGSGK